jgi:hypothetical protein
VCVDKFIPDGCKSIKLFSAKKNVTKMFLAEIFVTDFFSNSIIKKIFKILENIFLDFSFSKKQ